MHLGSRMSHTRNTISSKGAFNYLRLRGRTLTVLLAWTDIKELLAAKAERGVTSRRLCLKPKALERAAKTAAKNT